jgi:hypothetical protein
MKLGLASRLLTKGKTQMNTVTLGMTKLEVTPPRAS